MVGRTEGVEEVREDVEEIYFRYGNMLYRTAVVMLGHRSDAEDTVQDTLIRYMEHKKAFRDEEHRKAWLLRVCINLCKNRLLFKKRHPQIQFMDLTEYYERSEDGWLMELLMKLPESYRAVLLMYYVMGYNVRETARILGVTESAVKKRMERARGRLRELAEKEGVEEWNLNS